MEQAITILIYFHAFLGGLGLITGLMSVTVKKGSPRHRKAGKIFSYSMAISSLFALFVSRMPKHENLFLSLIGIFTIYLVLAGNRALTFKRKDKVAADNLDKAISGIMFLASIAMITVGGIGWMQGVSNSVLYIFFGAFGAFMSISDFRMFRDFSKSKNTWLKSHLGRMTGALIASITAFMVVGLNIGTVLIWIAPTIIGTIYIVYWNKSLKVKPAYSE